VAAFNRNSRSDSFGLSGRNQRNTQKDPELLESTRKKYAVRSPERQLQIDLDKGYVRLVPLEYYDLGAKELQRVVLFRKPGD